MSTPEMNETEFDFDKQIYWLLKQEPFFAALSRHIDKRKSDSCPTAGVRVTDEGRYEMVYNQKFFEGMTPDQRRGVLKHEFYHLIFEHVTTRKPEDPLLFKRWNIATDLAINSHIPRNELPDNGCIPGEGPFKEYPEKQTGEWYFAKLNNEEEDGNSGEPMDDHDGWDDSNEPIDPAVKEIAKQRLKEMMKDAADEASKKSWGSVSADMQKEIMRRVGGKVDWRSVLRYFVKTSKRADKSSTVKRLNKRFPYIHAGKKIRRHANIAISIDQSGSVSDDLLQKFFAELNKLADIATFTVVPFDTEVDEKLVYEWKKGTKHKAERVKCGGTDFDAPTKFVNGKKFDGHIILTDMYAPKPISSKCQRMWMTNEEGVANPYFKTNERVIAVD